VEPLQVVGRHAPRLDSVQVVTGAARYVADLSMSGMLAGALLYPPHPCARIRRIDTSRAKALPGVAAVLTHTDIPGRNSFYYGGQDDQPLLVSGAVRYQGDIIAAVAAENAISARKALDAIEIDYEPVDGVFDPSAAMLPGAVSVWPDRPNLHESLVIERGDIATGFSEAEVTIENEYSTQLIEHAFLEPEGALAFVEADGTVVVYSSTQAPHSDRTQIARALGVAEHRVRVITPHIGGAFGGKQEGHVQIHAALLANATGRPVRIIRSREESIRTHVKRHPVRIRFKTGATRDGLLIAIAVEAIGDTGPYVNAGAEVMSVLAATASGPYAVPHARIEVFTVFTNNPIAGAMRGFGIPQATFACEQQMDLVAKAVGLDPLEIRLRNGVDTGMHLPSGAKVREGRPMRECLTEAADRSGWHRRGDLERQPAAHLRRGWGIASSFKTVGMGRGFADAAGIGIEMMADGTVVVRTGASDMGQGAHTVLAQMVAEEFGVELGSVRVIPPDTDQTVDAGPSCASRVTFVSGNAARTAAAPIRDSLLRAAAEITDRPVDELTLSGGYVEAAGEQVLSITGAAAAARDANLPLHSDGFYAMEYPEEAPEYGYPHASEVFSFGTQIAQVLVDVETGGVEVESLTLVHDAGRVVNPGGALGQIEGSAAMGLGYALIEELHTATGTTVNDSLESYLIPTAADVPPMNVGIVEIPEPLAPYGAKGIGETSLAPVPPAVANAVADAIGVRITDLPITPERVLEAIKEGPR
jgi:CO/xanthine dehydrogenase Mo-binding subunit